MTPTKRLIRSRQTLARYKAARAAGEPINDVAIWTREVVELRKIAAEHPAKAETIAKLIGQWEVLILEG